MYPKEVSTLNNKFVRRLRGLVWNFEVDEEKQVLHYKRLASATRDPFIGDQELLRPTFPDAKHLVNRPANPNQHWSVTWENN